MNWDRLLRHSQIYNLLVRPREPEHGVIFLSQRRVYILPTRQGILFGAALMLMLVGSINYNLSLGYVLTFLLAGVALVSILHTFRNLAHLYVSAGRVNAVFAGDTARFGLRLENRRPVARHSIGLACGASTSRCNVPAEGATEARIAVSAERRGWLQLPRVTLDTRFPLGLFRAWSYVQPELRALVYPKPDQSMLPLPQAVPDSGDSVLAGTGTDDFAGIRQYRSGDSLRHIAWKAVARGGQMVTKVFTGRASSELRFDWDSLPDLDAEARLSRLTRWVLLADRHGLSYGLRLPGTEVALGEGESQRERCLKALALHDLPEHPR